jgi:hypothetical protein
MASIPPMVGSRRNNSLEQSSLCRRRIADSFFSVFEAPSAASQLKRLLRTVLGLTRRQPICRCPPTSTPKWLPGIASPLDTVRFCYSGNSVPIMELDLVIATPLESALQVSSAIFGGVSFRQYFAPRRVLLSYLLNIGVYPGRIQEVKPCYSNDHPSVVSDSFEQ